ncbi:MAG: NAD(P)/FAD-dependent oxidoreductase [Planktomarina sp.]
MSHIVVVGAGQAGSSLVFKLRNLGFDGQITLIGAEAAAPYQRPPLSKKYLLGDMPLDRLYLRPPESYSELGITLRTGSAVTGVDAAAKTVTVGDEILPYDHLALTTGSAPRRLPAVIGGDLDGVFTVRDLVDVDRMTPAFEAGGHVLVIGGGYIGLEAAAVAATKGLKVTLVEMADRILQRVASAETSDFFRDLHTNKGVNIVEGVGLDRLTGDGKVSGAVLSDGTELDIDFAIVGVGINPETALAEMAGVTLNNGIETNSYGQTSDPSIWAAGDCASFPFQGGRIRLESVPNAIDQAEIIAENIMGADKEYVAKPWFWSDQYDVKLQIAGLNTGYDQVVVRDGGDARSHWYYCDGQLIAVDAMNDPRGYMIAKRVIEAGKTVPADAAANPDTDLKPYMK